MNGDARRPEGTPLRLVRALLLVLLVAAPAIGVAAQDAPAAVAGVQVTRDEATPDFPKGIDFAVDAAAPGPIADVELLYRPVTSQTLIQEEPAFTPGERVAVTHEVDLEAGDLPPGIDLRYHWRFVEADGDVVDTPERTIAWQDTRFAWAPLAGPRVTVYAYNDDPAFNQQILDSAEQTIDSLATRFGAKPLWPIRIWVYSSKEDFAGALAPNSEPWIAGAAFPPLGLIQAILPPGDLSEVGRVVPHEISHQVLYAATKNPFGGPPGWLDEGLAVHAQANGADGYPGLARQALDQGKLPSLRALNGEFPYDTPSAQLAYAASDSVVRFILDRWGENGMAKLIAAFAQGVTVDEATDQALGVDLDGLDRDWRAWLATQPLPGPAGFLGGGGRDDPWAAVGLASGSLLMGVVALVAIAAAVASRRRARASDEPAPHGEWSMEGGPR